MRREEIIRHIAAVTGKDTIVSTTGKASRELFEISAANGQSHGHDCFTVGSMGHSSSIAQGIALQKPEKKVWIIDGDGAVLMHIGSMAVMGATGPKNIVHVVINNGAHEAVGGMLTAAGKIDIVQIAKGCRCPNAVSVADFEALDAALKAAKERDELSLIEVKCAIGARDDLGRPPLRPGRTKKTICCIFRRHEDNAGRDGCRDRARYGKGIKQLEPVGPNGELITDYSVHDAVQAGFGRVVFIIRRSISDDFRAALGDRVERCLAPLGIKPEYVFQETDDLPAGRKKPWGQDTPFWPAGTCWTDPSPSSTPTTTMESMLLSRPKAFVPWMTTGILPISGRRGAS